jgi:antitoxin HicB
MRMAERRGRVYTIILQPETDADFEGCYNASVPALPGCFSYGTTREEALHNIKEAIELYLEDLEAAGEAIPEEQIERVEVAF